MSDTSPKDAVKAVAEIKRNGAGQVYIDWLNDGAGSIDAMMKLVGQKLYTAPPSVEALEAEIESLRGMKFSDRMYPAIKSRMETAEAEVKRLKENLEVNEAQVGLCHETIDSLRATNAAQAEQLAAMTELANKWKQSAIEAMTEPQAGVELTDEEILGRAHRYCTKYKHDFEHPYHFSEHGMLEFVRLRLNQRQAVKAEPVAYGLFWQNHEGEDVLQFPVAGLEEDCKDDLKHYSPEVQKQMTIRPLYTEPLSAAQGVPEELRARLDKCISDWASYLRSERNYELIRREHEEISGLIDQLSAAPEQAESKEGKV